MCPILWSINGPSHRKVCSPAAPCHSHGNERVDHFFSTSTGCLCTDLCLSRPRSCKLRFTRSYMCLQSLNQICRAFHAAEPPKRDNLHAAAQGRALTRKTGMFTHYTHAHPNRIRIKNWKKLKRCTPGPGLGRSLQLPNAGTTGLNHRKGLSEA